MSKLTVSTTIHAPREIVWNAMWDPAHIIHWCFASDDWHCPEAVGEAPRVGGIFTNTFAAKDGSFSFDLMGQFTAVDPMRSASYMIGEMKEYFLPAGRQVEVLFDETPEGIRVTDIFDAEDIHSHEQQIAGWSAILTNLKKYTETL